MITTTAKPSIIPEPEIDILSTHSEIKVYQLVMQWTLDENSKLICQWVKVEN